MGIKNWIKKKLEERKISKEENKARLAVFQQREKELNEIYMAALHEKRKENAKKAGELIADRRLLKSMENIEKQKPKQSAFEQIGNIGEKLLNINSNLSESMMNSKPQNNGNKTNKS